MRVDERATQTLHHGKGLLEWKSSARSYGFFYKFIQWLAFQQFHDQEGHAILGLVKVVDRSDVRMSELLLAARFPLQGYEGVGMLFEVFIEDFERYQWLFVPCANLDEVAAEIHKTHATGAQHPVQAEASSQDAPGADSQGRAFFRRIAGDRVSA